LEETFFEYLQVERWAVGLPLQDWLVVGRSTFFIFLMMISIIGQGHSILRHRSGLEIGETSYILGSHHPRALQGFVLVLVERGGGLCPLL
jgi:hypothetical protein